MSSKWLLAMSGHTSCVKQRAPIFVRRGLIESELGEMEKRRGIYPKGPEVVHNNLKSVIFILDCKPDIDKMLFL